MGLRNTGRRGDQVWQVLGLVLCAALVWSLLVIGSWLLWQVARWLVLYAGAWP